MGAIYTYSFDYWIGLSDTDIPGTYLWVDGSYPTLSAWAPSQPGKGSFKYDAVNRRGLLTNCQLRAANINVTYNIQKKTPRFILLYTPTVKHRY